jgi:hypothetical protein
MYILPGRYELRSVLSYLFLLFSDAFSSLLTKVSRTRSTVSADGPGRPAPFRSAPAAILLEFLVPLTNCFICTWFCVVLGPKPPLHRHNLLSFGKFQDTERFFIPCPRHISSRLHLAVKTASTPWRLLPKQT